MAGPSFRDRLPGLAAAIRREAARGIYAAGQRVQVEAQIAITTGAVSGTSHVASKPGEAPNQDTGVLGNNIETVQLAPLHVQISSNAPYSAALELGTSKMAERPFMRPAAQAARPDIHKIMAAAVKRAVRDHFRK